LGFFLNLKHVNLEYFVAATEKKPYRCNLKENSFCIDVVHLKIQVLVCIRLCYIWVLTLLSSRLELFSVAELIWKWHRMTPYSLKLGHHGSTRNVPNSVHLCTMHQGIQLGSQFSTCYLRYNWKQFFGALGLRLASSPLTLYHGQVNCKAPFFQKAITFCDIISYHNTLYIVLLASKFFETDFFNSNRYFSFAIILCSM
jgi:hypothetical protein